MMAIVGIVIIIDGNVKLDNKGEKL